MVIPGRQGPQEGRVQQETTGRLVQRAFRVSQDPAARQEALALLDRLLQQVQQELRAQPDQQEIRALQGLWGRLGRRARLGRLALLGHQEPDQQGLRVLLVLVPLVQQDLQERRDPR